MIIFFILGLVLGIIAVIFALQNITIVTVTFLHWQITNSLAAILMVSIAAGMLITLLIFLPKFLSDYFAARRLQKEVVRLEEELRKQKVMTVFAKETPPTPEVIEGIQKGATLTREEYNHNGL